MGQVVPVTNEPAEPSTESTGMNKGSTVDLGPGRKAMRNIRTRTKRIETDTSESKYTKPSYAQLREERRVANKVARKARRRNRRGF